MIALLWLWPLIVGGLYLDALKGNKKPESKGQQ